MIDLKNINYNRILKRYDLDLESQEDPAELVYRLVPEDSNLRKLSEDIVFMKYKELQDDINAALATVPPEEVIEHGLIKGMEIVSELYGRGIYYFPHVMMAADLMDRGLKMCESNLTKERETKGKVVMHVAEGDPHDIGKNIAAVLLKSNGYTVIDLGRDVLMQDVISAVEKEKPDIITGTALMTTTMSAFPRIAAKLYEKNMEMPFICAGGAVNREYVESFPMGIYCSKAADGPRLANRILEGWDWKKVRDNWDRIVSKKN